MSHRAYVQVVQAGHLQPLAEKMLLDAGFCLEDGQRDGSDGDSIQMVSNPHAFTSANERKEMVPKRDWGRESTLEAFYLVY